MVHIHIRKAPLIIALVLLAIACTIIYVLTNMYNNSVGLYEESDANFTDLEDGFTQVDWQYWQSINSDVIGWINVPDTNINYPILQAHSNDPDFYLHHDIYKQYNVYGVPYLDADCKDLGFKSLNGVVFGHHMNDGTMFSAFSSFSDKAFAQSHQKIFVQTRTEKMIYNVRFVQIVDGSQASKRTRFLDSTDFTVWYEQTLNDSVVVLDEITRPSSVLSFVTCSYHFSRNERTVVIASLEKSGPQGVLLF